MRYNSIDDNRADYLLVWGKKIKSNYINQGVNESKIIVTGHPMYSGCKIKNKLRFSLENILVISRSIISIPSDSQNGGLEGRDNLIDYLLKVKKNLSSVGVSSVRLRLHPSESQKWYRQTFDMSFFIIDNEKLNDSLKKSTLVVGPTSTVFLESIIAGVNYIVYDPISYSFKVDPFDGLNPKVPVALNDFEFKDILDKRRRVDPTVIEEYINPDFAIDKLFSKL